MRSKAVRRDVFDWRHSNWIDRDGIDILQDIFKTFWLCMYNYDLLENSLAHQHKSVTFNIIIRLDIIIPSHVINSHGYYHFYFILLELFDLLLLLFPRYFNVSAIGNELMVKTFVSTENLITHCNERLVNYIQYTAGCWWLLDKFKKKLNWMKIVRFHFPFHGPLLTTMPEWPRRWQRQQANIFLIFDFYATLISISVMQ